MSFRCKHYLRQVLMDECLKILQALANPDRFVCVVITVQYYSLEKS
ncbi:MAG: hypothetical protein RMX96_20070 [Nostoc sp. ChiSLP02]|nr:hypothetical protein [Nostoc sp. DedSLP05]MDZ8187131.1 hypothetical protein [Nostoc sp. ChiSLP02]